MHAVVAQQVGQRVGVGQVVDRHEIEGNATLLGGADDEAADAAESVDSNAKGHGRPVSRRRGATGGGRARTRK